MAPRTQHLATAAGTGQPARKTINPARKGAFYEDDVNDFSRLLGLVFKVFGLNGFLNLCSTVRAAPRRTIPGRPRAVAESHDALALTLAPVIFNILLFHITMAPAGLRPAVFLTILWLATAHRVRGAFAGLLQDGTREPSRHSAQGVAQMA